MILQPKCRLNNILTSLIMIKDESDDERITMIKLDLINRFHVLVTWRTRPFCILNINIH